MDCKTADSIYKHVGWIWHPSTVIDETEELCPELRSSKTCHPLNNLEGFIIVENHHGYLAVVESITSCYTEHAGSLDNYASEKGKKEI